MDVLRKLLTANVRQHETLTLHSKRERKVCDVVKICILSCSCHLHVRSVAVERKKPSERLAAKAYSRVSYLLNIPCCL